MKKEVAKQESTEVVEVPQMSDWGEVEVDASNILIPKVLLMQGLSEMVADEKAKIGDMLYSLDDKIIGGTEKPLEFIPFHIDMIWIVKHDGEFHHIEPQNAANKNLQWEELVNGVQVQNVLCMNVYAILANDLSMPVIIPFKSTSLKAGKKVTTQMYFTNKTANMIPPAITMELSSTKTKNDKGTFAVLDTKAKRASSKEEIAAAFKWFKAVNAGETKADDSDVMGPEVDASTGSGDF